MTASNAMQQYAEPTGSIAKGKYSNNRCHWLASAETGTAMTGIKRYDAAKLATARYL